MEKMAYRASDIACALGITASGMRHMIKSGKIKGVKIGGRYYISAREYCRLKTLIEEGDADGQT